MPNSRMAPASAEATATLGETPHTIHSQSQYTTFSNSCGRTEPDTPSVLLVATPALQECARHLAKARQAGHNHCRRPDQELGSYAFTAEYCGVLAELTVYDALERQGQHPRYTLLADRSLPEPDMRLAGCTYEIKACPLGKRYLTINHAHHHNARCRPDYYLPVLFDTEDTLRVMAPVPHTEVSGWSLMTNGHSPYYSTHCSCLMPLGSLDLLTLLGEQETASEE